MSTTDAVHYESDGQWLDIDNTLKATGTGANAAYTNTAGVWDVQFPQNLSAGKPGGTRGRFCCPLTETANI